MGNWYSRGGQARPPSPVRADPNRKCMSCRGVRRELATLADQDICRCGLPMPPEQNFQRELGLLFNEQHLVKMLYDYYYNGHPKIGEYREGGVVFYVDTATKRALVSAIRDVGMFAWGPERRRTNINETGFFSGKQNTDRLCALGTRYSAAVAARRFMDGGYRDWYLPSKDELSEIYKQRDIISVEAIRRGGAAFVDRFTPSEDNWAYWSSSEYQTWNLDGGWAWSFRFPFDKSSEGPKDARFNVRPIRTFSYLTAPVGPRPASAQQRVCKYHPPAGYLYEPDKITQADNCFCTLEQQQAREQQRARHVRIFQHFEHFPEVQQRFLMEHEGLFNESHLSNILYRYYSTGHPKLGDYIEGGVVFYVDTVSRRALVSAVRDMGLFPWGKGGREKVGTNIKETGFFSGKQNTDRLCALGAGYQAAQAARGCREGGYGDWYLPSRDELNEMYKQKAVINGESLKKGGASFIHKDSGKLEQRYWSSSEAYANSAWFVAFNNGECFHSLSVGSYSGVRPIRAFNY